jgi:uncharacterized protein YraI
MRSMRLLRALAPLVLALAAVLPSVAADAVPATVAKRGNVRFGPSTSAPIAVTLPPGSAVEILGAVQKGDETWYQIRFPRQGKAWIHTMNLQKIDEKQYKVTAKARIRDDATMGANIVSEVEPGDVVEYQGTTVGQWLMVYPPRAVAYVSATVLNLPNAGAPGAPVVNVPVVRRPVERLWLTAKQTYAGYAATASDTAQQGKAQTLDWPGLSRQLGEVAKDHPETEVRLQAARLKNGVDEVVNHLKRLGIAPTVAVPQPEAVADLPTAPAQPIPPAQQMPPVAPIPEQPVAPQPPVAVPQAPADPVPGQGQPTTLDAQQALAQVATQANVAKIYVAEGFLEQRGDAYVLFDSNSRVTAFVKPIEGSTVSLSEYFWRQVGVSGRQDGTAKDDDGREVPVYLVDDLALIGK